MHNNPLIITQEIKDLHTGHIKLIGHLSMQAETALKEQAENLGQQNYKTIELDFSDLVTISGAGLKHLEIFLARSKRLGLTISARGITDEINAIFKLTYLNEIMQILEDA